MDLLAWNGLLWLTWAAYWFASARFVKATKSSESALGRLQHLAPLAIGFFLIFYGAGQVLIFGLLYRSQIIRWLGMALTAEGLGFAVWARVHLGRNWSGMITLKEGHELVRSGPYRYVRHPIYTGFLTAALGSALVARSGDAFIGFAIILVAILVKIHREDAVLTREFGDQYRAFRQEVATLVPFVF
jgi:protein-S-isoprenylcysteine O-methyltransferase Ste14